MPMDCRIRWVGTDGMSFVAETGSGHAFVMDGAPEGGGRNLEGCAESTKGGGWRSQIPERWKLRLRS